MIAVLTGDIVASSRVPEDQRAAMLDRLDRAIGSLSPLAQQIFRGDAFQAALAEPARCLDAALQLQLRMEAPDFADGPSRELRLGLGLGEATAPPGEPIGRWSGRAFVQAPWQARPHHRSRETTAVPTPHPTVGAGREPTPTWSSPTPRCSTVASSPNMVVGPPSSCA